GLRWRQAQQGHPGPAGAALQDRRKSGDRALMTDPSDKSPDNRLSRRGLLLGAAAGTLGAATAASTAAQADARASEASVDLMRELPFYGDAEQAGIRTPPQRHVFYMTFDLTSTSRTDLQVLLARWSGAIAQLMKGRTIGQVEPARPNSV